jgi:predicted AlkP superfamily pyrophosphatase or phosphodiesterase
VKISLLQLGRLLAGLALLAGGCKPDVGPIAPPKVSPTRAVAAQSDPRPEHIVLVSFDGARPDFVQQAQMPTLHAMAREGAVTWTARSIVPPLTLPAHTSMLTGLAPEEHGVYWNQWIPAFGALRAQTVFMLAKSNGLSCAVFSGKDKLAHLFPTGSVDHVSFPLTHPGDWSATNVFAARNVAAQAVSYFTQHKPRLMFVHFPDADMAGHFYGWPSPEQFSALAECDVALALLRTGVERAGGTNNVFVLTADHGGAGLNHGVDRPQDMTIPWIVWGAGVRRGHVLTNQVTLPDTAATLAWLFGFSLPTNAIGQPVREAFR